MGIYDRCPDGGTCHHECLPLNEDPRAEQPAPFACFRVRFCGPLSHEFPDDEWPPEIRAEHAFGRPGKL